MQMHKKKWFFYGILLMVLLVGDCLGLLGQARASTRDTKESLEVWPQKQLTFVAHEDDDLLFMNPDLIKRIKEGQWIETIYVTSGDRGKGPNYWLTREAGVKAAYAFMAGVPDSWQESHMDVEDKVIVKFTLKAMPRVNLIFLRLPDGINDRTGEVTLKYIWKDDTLVAHGRDNVNSYNKKELLAVLLRLTQEYQPTNINYVYPGVHVDHRYVAKFAMAIQKAYKGDFTVIKYRDYVINKYPPNLMEDETNMKWKVATVYGKYDWYFPKFMLEKKYQNYYNWCKREYRYGNTITERTVQ